MVYAKSTVRYSSFLNTLCGCCLPPKDPELSQRSKVRISSSELWSSQSHRSSSSDKLHKPWDGLSEQSRTQSSEVSRRSSRTQSSEVSRNLAPSQSFELSNRELGGFGSGMLLFKLGKPLPPQYKESLNEVRNKSYVGSFEGSNNLYGVSRSYSSSSIRSWGQVPINSELSYIRPSEALGTSSSSSIRGWGKVPINSELSYTRPSEALGTSSSSSIRGWGKVPINTELSYIRPSEVLSTSSSSSIRSWGKVPINSELSYTRPSEVLGTSSSIRSRGKVPINSELSYSRPSDVLASSDYQSEESEDLEKIFQLKGNHNNAATRFLGSSGR